MRNIYFKVIHCYDNTFALRYRLAIFKYLKTFQTSSPERSKARLWFKILLIMIVTTKRVRGTRARRKEELKSSRQRGRLWFFFVIAWAVEEKQGWRWRRHTRNRRGPSVHLARTAMTSVICQDSANRRAIGSRTETRKRRDYYSSLSCHRALREPIERGLYHQIKPARGSVLSSSFSLFLLFSSSLFWILHDGARVIAVHRTPRYSGLLSRLDLDSQVSKSGSLEIIFSVWEEERERKRRRGTDRSTSDFIISVPDYYSISFRVFFSITQQDNYKAKRLLFFTKIKRKCILPAIHEFGVT